MRILDELTDRQARGDIELNEWEEGFIESMTDRVAAGKKLSGPQFKKLNEIYDEHIGDTT